MTNKFRVGALAALACAPAYAQSVTDLLQKGIYAQEAAGDLDGAIQLFRQAIDASAPSRMLAGQALYHMGSAQAAKGDVGGAAQTFRQLIDQYPEQRDLAARLQPLLPGFKQPASQPNFTATIYRDPGSGLSFALPPGWTATQSAIDSTLPNPGVNIDLHDPESGEPSIFVWVRTQKTDPSTVPQKILATPDMKEAQMRKDGIADFTVRRESLRPLQVGANKGLSAIAEYTSDNTVASHSWVITMDQATLNTRQDRAVSTQPLKRAELFSWLWGADVRIVIFARDLDPAKLSEMQPVFDSIVSTFIVP